MKRNYILSQLAKTLQASPKRNENGLMVLDLSQIGERCRNRACQQFPTVIEIAARRLSKSLLDVLERNGYLDGCYLEYDAESDAYTLMFFADSAIPPVSQATLRVTQCGEVAFTGNAATGQMPTYVSQMQSENMSMFVGQLARVTC